MSNQQQMQHQVALPQQTATSSQVAMQGTPANSETTLDVEMFGASGSQVLDHVQEITYTQQIKNIYTPVCYETVVRFFVKASLMM